METQTVILPSIQTLKGKGYTLTVISSQNTQKISVKNRLLTIGTHPDNDVVIQDVVASRFHAKIELDVYGHKVVDDDSKNGVFVNGLRVIKELYLSHQCELQIGTTRLKYEINDQENVEIQLSKEKQFGKLIGESAMMRELFVLLAKIAPTDLTVLVEGESGTGKELVAEALHLNSPRAKQPFVVFDCSAVPTSLIESELFGHLKGSFTGATQDRLGAFQRAEGGTLFLDEMGELPIELQSRLLRALEKKEVKRVGQDEYRKLDVRVIAATNRNLEHEVEMGKFRQDLYYRLAVLKFRLPALRQRKSDIPLLVKHFISQMDQGQRIEIGYDTMLKLQKHPWTGNVRELKNFVERAVLLTQHNRLETRFLDPMNMLQNQGSTQVIQRDEIEVRDEEHEEEIKKIISNIDITLPFKDAKERLIDEFEKNYWLALLKKTNDNMSAAARIAGVHRKSAEYLLKKHNIR